MNICISNDSDLKLPDRYEDIVRDIICASIEYVGCPYECEVSVTFTDNEGIRMINKETRDIDSPTDVLSFPMIDYENPADFNVVDQCPDLYINLESDDLMLGDIVISLEKVEEQAEEYGHSVFREVAFLTAHSMLHLFGYDHIDDEDREVMEAKQTEILNMKGYTRDYE